MTQIYARVALIGLGLIASSMAHAMRAQGLAGEIVGHAKSPETRAVALQIGLCDRVYATAAEAVQGADLVVLAVPVGPLVPLALLLRSADGHPHPRRPRRKVLNF